MKRGFLYKSTIRTVPFMLAVLMRGWFKTCRITEHGLENREKALDSKSVVAVFWHYSLVYVFYHLRRERAAVLVSASEDGEYIARLAHCLSFETVRGSRNRRGLLALKELQRYLEDGYHIGMVGDGSQGPELVAQAGSIALASRTGASVLPMAWSASRSFSFRSWDRTCVPMPFSRIDYFYGDPIDVPAGLDRDGIETYRLEVDRELNRLYRMAWKHYHREKHYDD